MERVVGVLKQKDDLAQKLDSVSKLEVRRRGADRRGVGRAWDRLAQHGCLMCDERWSVHVDPAFECTCTLVDT
jgi:hypothetical protein